VGLNEPMPQRVAFPLLKPRIQDWGLEGRIGRDRSLQTDRDQLVESIEFVLSLISEARSCVPKAS
jgi:hypothetical protein